MRRDTVDSGDLGLLELARSDELGIFGRDGDAFVRSCRPPTAMGRGHCANRQIGR
nr:MAG TPA: hypothetical protein [Caudoviricetes sp.]